MAKYVASPLCSGPALLPPFSFLAPSAASTCASKCGDLQHNRAYRTNKKILLCARRCEVCQETIAEWYCHLCYSSCTSYDEAPYPDMPCEDCGRSEAYFESDEKKAEYVGRITRVYGRHT
jgi:hypothetical protein